MIVPCYQLGEVEARRLHVSIQPAMKTKIVSFVLGEAARPYIQDNLSSKWEISACIYNDEKFLILDWNWRRRENYMDGFYGLRLISDLYTNAIALKSGALLILQYIKIIYWRYYKRSLFDTHDTAFPTLRVSGRWWIQIQRLDELDTKNLGPKKCLQKLQCYWFYQKVGKSSQIKTTEILKKLDRCNNAGIIWNGDRLWTASSCRPFFKFR